MICVAPPQRFAGITSCASGSTGGTVRYVDILKQHAQAVLVLGAAQSLITAYDRQGGFLRQRQRDFGALQIDARAFAVDNLEWLDQVERHQCRARA